MVNGRMGRPSRRLCVSTRRKPESPTPVVLPSMAAASSEAVRKRGRDETMGHRRRRQGAGEGSAVEVAGEAEGHVWRRVRAPRKRGECSVSGVGLGPAGRHGYQC